MTIEFRYLIYFGIFVSVICVLARVGRFDGGFMFAFLWTLLHAGRMLNFFLVWRSGGSPDLARNFRTILLGYPFTLACGYYLVSRLTG